MKTDYWIKMMDGEKHKVFIVNKREKLCVYELLDNDGNYSPYPVYYKYYENNIENE